jgi:hypothetical protein
LTGLDHSYSSPEIKFSRTFKRNARDMAGTYNRDENRSWRIHHSRGTYLGQTTGTERCE